MGGERRGALLLGLVVLLQAVPAWAERPGAAPPAVQLGVREWFGRPPAPRDKAAWQRDKNPTVAMLSSFLVPGLGQLYYEREFWAVVAAGVHFYFLGDIIVEARLTNHYRTLKNQAQKDAEFDFLVHRDNRIQSTWLLGLTLLLSGLQSFVDAHLFGFDADAPLRLEAATGSVRGGALRLRF